MGTWGFDPWDNDSAADWFGELWDDTPIVDRVLEGLRSGGGHEMLAALWLCTQLCRVYVWPVYRLDETLDAAIAAADQLLAGADENGLVELWSDADVDIVTQIKGYRSELTARRNRAGDD
ncbi:MAG TPA: hypothetical protein VFJ85_19530 [Acidimicrobiales bacterium]|nr:hypothetical protein [Acidimicrobiales bacterium]